MNEIKKYHVKIQIRNNILLTFIKKDSKTVQEFADKCGIHVHQVYNYLSFKINPISKKTGTYRESAKKIAEQLQLHPCILFPDEFDQIEHHTISIEANRDFFEHGSIQYDDKLKQIGDNTHLRAAINAALEDLPAREKIIINMHYGLNGTKQHTLQEISEKFKISSERVRQIEKKAIKRLRHPVRAKYFEDFIGQ